MSPNPRQSRPVIPREDESDPPPGDVHGELRLVKARLKQVEADVDELERDVARLDGEHTDSKIKAVRIEDFISREQASRNEWRATIRGIVGAVSGTVILGALATVAKLLWEAFKR